MRILGKLFSRNSQVADRLAEEVEILHNSPLMDPAWYRRAYPDLHSKPIDCARHYLEYGAAEGRNPHPLFDTNFYLRQNPDVAALGMNPLVHYILHGAEEGRKPNPFSDTSSLAQPQLHSEDSGTTCRRHFETTDVIEAMPHPAQFNSQQRFEQEPNAIEPSKNDIAGYFDIEFYLEKNRDVADANVDPLDHYFFKGWREGRDPTPWFSTNYYLSSNQDVAATNANPFWHYVIHGRGERRSPKPTMSTRYLRLSHLMSPRDLEIDPNSVDGERITEADLLQCFRTKMQNAVGLVVSFSHSCYPKTLGGIELFLRDEQRLFNARGFVYLHFSPLAFSRFINNKPSDESLTQITLDGERIGVAAFSQVAQAIECANCAAFSSKVLVMHCALGLSKPGFLRILSAMHPTSCYYWVHDYSSICTGINLLRNELEFCHAPLPESISCTICVYGSSRRSNLEYLNEIFKAVNFTVVSPSIVAQNIWLKAAHLPYRAAVIQEHCTIDYTAGLERKHRFPENIGLPQYPVKVAFVGPMHPHKGQLVIERVIEETKNDVAYEFFHFTMPNTQIRSDRVRAIDAVITPNQRNVMVDALQEHEIDIVVLPGPCPETFSYVTFEALAAGCDVITLASSGNIAATVLKTKRGEVFSSADELVGFFSRHRAIDFVRSRAIQPNPRGLLLHRGTTAALVFGSSH